MCNDTIPSVDWYSSKSLPCRDELNRPYLFESPLTDDRRTTDKVEHWSCCSVPEFERRRSCCSTFDSVGSFDVCRRSRWAGQCWWWIRAENASRRTAWWHAFVLESFYNRWRILNTCIVASEACRSHREPCNSVLTNRSISRRRSRSTKSEWKRKELTSKPPPRIDSGA